VSGLAEFIRDLTSLLSRSDVDYMLTGSIASTYYSEPRSTVDVDIVVTTSSANLLEFAHSLDRQRFYVPSDETILSDSQFNVIETSSGWKLDVMARRDRPFSVVEFDRRRRVTLIGVDTFIASAEDVMLSKLEWAKMSGSERQLGDVQSILAVQGEALDFAYLRKWAADLAVSDTLERLLTEQA
jgi:hypothetical protein